MSRHLFDIADLAAVDAHRSQMELAFFRPIDDPNYMPVTRDMSAAKREIIIKWLRLPPQRRAQAPGPPPFRGAAAEGGGPRVAAPVPSNDDPVFDVKRDTPRRAADRTDGED
jgi:hypothetical protein